MKIKMLILILPSFFIFNFFSFCHSYTGGDQKVRGKKLPFLHPLLNRAGITAHNTMTHMKLIGYNMLDVSRLLQLSPRQRYIA